MATIAFIFEGISTPIQCFKGQKMIYICDKFCNKIGADINSLLFLYGGSKINMDKKFEEYSKDNIIQIFVFRNEYEICPKCGKFLDNKKIDNLISSNNNINSILIGLKSQIDHIITDINDKKQINEINSQLKNLYLIINHIIEDIKKNNEELNKAKIMNSEGNTNYDKQKKKLFLLENNNNLFMNYNNNYKNNYAFQIRKENINNHYRNDYDNQKNQLKNINNQNQNQNNKIDLNEKCQNETFNLMKYFQCKTPEEEKNYLGEILFELIKNTQIIQDINLKYLMIGKITGMILDLPENEIFETLDNSSELNSRIQEALCLIFEILNIS